MSGLVIASLASSQKSYKSNAGLHLLHFRNQAAFFSNQICLLGRRSQQRQSCAIPKPTDTGWVRSSWISFGAVAMEILTPTEGHVSGHQFLDRSHIDFLETIDSSSLTFVEAMAKNEILYIGHHADSRMNYYRSSTQPQYPSEAVSLLKRYLKIADAMIPTHKSEILKDINSPTLWHPDLHLDNIFVDPKSRQITSIIDWQWSAVLPLYYQCGIPRAFENPRSPLDGAQLSELPHDYASLPQDERTRMCVMGQSEACQKFYELETSSKNPRHWTALQLDNLDLRRRPTRLALGLWDSENLFFFRKALMEIKEQWTELCPGSSQCPITFRKEELALHAYEEENQQGVGGILSLFKDRWSLPTDGMVDPADFAQTKNAIDENRKVFLETAEDEAEKELFSKLWPYQETDR